MSSGNIEYWFQSTVAQEAQKQWQAVFQKYMKTYSTKNQKQKERIDQQIKEELENLQPIDFDSKLGKIERVPKPVGFLSLPSIIYKLYYRECAEIVTPEDFDDAGIEKYLDEFEAQQESLAYHRNNQGDELLFSTRLTQEDKDLIAQKYETGGISLRKMLSVHRMKVPSAGHLAHYDEHLPYIAYVRF